MMNLVGKRIDRIFVSSRQEYLRFETDAGALVFEAQGDCCSESWFADLTGVDALLGGTVASVEALPVDTNPSDNERTRQECDEVHGYTITTDKGRASLAFRNSSNGYYGGWLTSCAGLTAEQLAALTPTEIADDWSA